MRLYCVFTSVLKDFGYSCNRLTLNEDVRWIKGTLMDILNSCSKIMRVTSYFERWWNEEMAKACKVWAKKRSG